MIDLHTHTLLSDGELLPSELVRRAHVKGYTAIALTDHVDSSNIDFVLPRLVKVCAVLNRSWKIISLPGVEITHAPLAEIGPLVLYARRNGAKVVIVHGETLSEPVIPGTNICGIEARCDILAHPGLISADDVKAAKRNGVYLELTTRRNHLSANKHIFSLSKRYGAKNILDNDTHSDKDLLSYKEAERFLKAFVSKREDRQDIIANSLKLLKSLKVRNKKVNS